ncbi:hypothetical protein NMY22_g19746 [Coprinellus aureogranulatus]|nr:hypothetical protein NMY22_g19746 [Coprinellus aureogranulatus]
MPKFSKEWLIEVLSHDENSKVIAGEKEYAQMRSTVFGGKPQSLYFSDGHESAGDFKGMAQILVERGITDAFGIHAECKGFKCVSMDVSAKCCCHRILFNQPDFVDVESKLEIIGKEEGVPVIFLPKYHCELNFIEQCWGYTKRVYRLNPESSQEEVLEANTISALASVPLVSMHRFANRSL